MGRRAVDNITDAFDYWETIREEELNPTYAEKKTAMSHSQFGLVIHSQYLWSGKDLSNYATKIKKARHNRRQLSTGLKVSRQMRKKPYRTLQEYSSSIMRVI